MAGVVKGIVFPRREQDHTHISGKNVGSAQYRLSKSYNGYKYCNYIPVGGVTNYTNYMCHSSQSVLRPKARQYRVIKAHNADSDESCNSETTHEDKKLLSSPPISKEGNQLEVLESYFSKLNPKKTQQSDSIHQKTDREDEYSLSKIKAEASMISDSYIYKNRLDSLEHYFNKLNTGTKNSLDSGADDYKDYLPFDEKSFLESHTDDQTSDFCMINLLAAINIAVLLFEVASPVRNSDIENLSLPLIYGAKINNLILSGEWWRLLTPMCLHSGFLHVTLGCWVLLTFGPRVCRAYGQVTFFLIYVLGGICGNLISFIHTPEITVCGTGPVFALIGAWLIYQSQNKKVVNKDVSESMFRQAVLAVALCFLLSSFGRIDNCAHFGATISGLVFGYLTCPSVELDNVAKDGREEAIALVQWQANPCKSLAIFTICVLVLASFTIAYGMQIDVLDKSN